MVEKDIPEHYVEEASKKRAFLVEVLANNDDELADLFLSDQELGVEHIKVECLMDTKEQNMHRAGN